MYKTIIISIYWLSFIVCVSIGTVCDKYWHLFDSLNKFTTKLEVPLRKGEVDAL